MEMIEVMPIRVRITAILRKSILAGELRPGQELTLTETAAWLGVSRTPVREAFQSLAAEGLLTLRMNRGAIVVGIDEKVIRDHFELQLLLETEAVRRAVSRRPDTGELERLQSWAEANRTTMTEEEYRNYNQRFHERLWRWSDNQKLYGMLSSLWNGPSGGNVGRDANHERLAIGEHRELLEYLRSGNAEAAGAVMTTHIVRSMNNILRSFRAANPEGTEN